MPRCNPWPSSLSRSSSQGLLLSCVLPITDFPRPGCSGPQSHQRCEYGRDVRRDLCCLCSCACWTTQRTLRTCTGTRSWTSARSMTSRCPLGMACGRAASQVCMPDPKTLRSVLSRALIALLHRALTTKH